MIVFHGTTDDCFEGIRRDGLRPGSFVAPSKSLAQEYAYERAIKVGANSCVIFELDVPDAAVMQVESWWWTGDQLLLPMGCPATCILSVDDSDPRRYQNIESE